MEKKCSTVNMDRLLVTDIGDNHLVGKEPDLFGIEVELEGMKVITLKESIAKYWGMHEDGSLRKVKPGAEAIEYVLKKPLDFGTTIKAVETLFEHLNTNPGTQVFESYRTSIHVHVNFLNDTMRTTANFITLALIFDELFVSQNGETRIGNNFCLRSKDAEGQLCELMASFKNYGSFFNLTANHRYSSINIASLLKFATIEFRSLECTTDTKRLIDWIAVIQNLKTEARKYDNPREIIAKFSRRGPLGFMVSCLGEQYVKYASVPNAQLMMRDGMRLAQDFAYCSEWQSPAAGVTQPKRKGALPGYKQFYNEFAGQPPQPNAHWGVNPAIQHQAPQPLQWQPIEAFNVVIEDEDDDD